MEGVFCWSRRMGTFDAFVAGILLLALELLVIPGFGVTGITGISALVISLYMVLRTTSILFWEVAFSQLLFYMAIMGGFS